MNKIEKQIITTKKENFSSSSREDFLNKNIDKLKTIRAWAVWYPDLFLELYKPQTGGITLCPDQRLFMRIDSRSQSCYFNGSRGSSKTFNNVGVAMVDCIVFPGIDIAISAQTVERAAALLKDKYYEFTRYYPAIENEVSKTSFTKNTAEIVFKNGSRLNVLGNSQNAKGARRKRLRIEESALMDNDIFEDALQPTVEVPRSTIGKLAIVNPHEMSSQINFYTSSGWRGSTEFDRIIQMRKEMVELDGKFVLGASWMIPSYYGRTSSKSKIMEIKKTVSPTSFDMNYMQVWTGQSSGALVDINRLLKCRNLSEPMIEPIKGAELVMGVDMARSQNESNNKTSISIINIKRNDATGKIVSLELVYLNNISNTLNFSNQALIIKRLRKKYNIKMVVIDGNGIGQGEVDQLLLSQYDPVTGDTFNCWNTINTSNQPEDPQNADDCLFDLKAQSYQTTIINTFMDVIGTGTLRLLEPRQYDVFEAEQDPDYMEKFQPFIQTDLFVSEVANLKLEVSGKNLSVSKAVSKIDKDRFSSVAYAVFWCMNFDNNPYHQDYSLNDIFSFRAPVLRAE